MLSVFITPWQKPHGLPLRHHLRSALSYRLQQRRKARLHPDAARCRGSRVELVDHMVGQGSRQLGQLLTWQQNAQNAQSG